LRPGLGRVKDAPRTKTARAATSSISPWSANITGPAQVTVGSPHSAGPVAHDLLAEKLNDRNG
jgi:hypothetical protein